MHFKKNVAVSIIILFFLIFIEPYLSFVSKADLGACSVKLNIDPFSIIYEGDVIDCEITGNPTFKYWSINNQSYHTNFYGNNPVIFDPEPTPLTSNYVNLTVYAENEFSSSSDTVQVIIKRIYFGDIHCHTDISDGRDDIDNIYHNAIADNYLDFVSCTEHAFSIDPALSEINFLNFLIEPRYLIKLIKDRIFGYNEWQIIKEKAEEYYNPNQFTTILGFEYSASWRTPGGRPKSPNSCEDVSHINFYYRDIYPDAPKYSAWMKLTYDDIFQAMADEWEKGHLNIGFPHHPLAGLKLKIGNQHLDTFNFTVNWSFLANRIENNDDRNSVLRGVETYSRWGTAIGKYSDIPIKWPYRDRSMLDHPDYWVENAMWEWSKNPSKDQRFVLFASSDTHKIDRPGSASKIDNRFSLPNPSGIVAAFAINNTRGEIWDAMNNCEIYGTQLLKIRANVRFDDQFAYGRWINVSSPLKINISAFSTFSGNDYSGKNMCPHGYSSAELNYPISDIWIIKKDRDRGRPWCKVISHKIPNTHMAVEFFEDADVQPNDFYWVAIRQKGQYLNEMDNSYMAFIGPIFIKNVF